MAPSTVAKAKPKRKRQRKRKEVESSDSSSSLSEEEEEEEEQTTVQAITLPQASTSSSSSSEASSSSEDESSEDERSKRRGRNSNLNKSNLTTSTSTSTSTATGTTTANNARRPYPSRSPSPQIFNPANLPLGQTPFPLLKTLASGVILNGLVVGDKGFGGGADIEGDDADDADAVAEKVKGEQLRETQFGEWWRARLVSEFETDLGGLASEPGLTPSRLTLLLDSLTALSTLHTTSSTLAHNSKSIWLHDPSAAVDPLSELELGEGGDEWGKKNVGGLADFEVGEEGVRIDLGKENNSNGNTTEKMEVD